MGIWDNQDDNGNDFLAPRPAAAPQGASGEQEPAEPTWFYLIYGTITTRETGSKFGPARAATILRSEPITVTNDSLFVFLINISGQQSRFLKRLH